MADQDPVSQNSIPPKVAPFAKPAAAGAAPGVPVAPRPITIRLKPVVPAAKPAGATPPLHATSRIAMPEEEAAPAAAPMAPAAAPLQPQPPPQPGSNPLPGGLKPPSNAQVQAAKSKTSRISLDSAIGVAPSAPMNAAEPKTIRLKRPSDLASSAVARPSAAPAVPAPAAASPVRKTSRIPDSALPTEVSAASESASVTQKKTLKIKRPGFQEPASAAAVEAGGEAFPEGVQLTPISAVESGLPKKDPTPVFTAITIAAACITLLLSIALTWCLAADVIAPVANANTTAWFSLGSTQLPWSAKPMN